MHGAEADNKEYNNNNNLKFIVCICFYFNLTSILCITIVPILMSALCWSKLNID